MSRKTANVPEFETMNLRDTRPAQIGVVVALVYWNHPVRVETREIEICVQLDAAGITRLDLASRGRSFFHDGLLAGVLEFGDANHPDRHLTARMLREVDLGAIELAVRGYVQRRRAALQLTASFDPNNMPAVRAATKRLGNIGRTRPGRGGKPDLYYAQIAARYVALCEISPHATQALASELHLSPSQVGNLLQEAQRRGLKTPPLVRGRQGGQLTAKAIELLRADASNSNPARDK